MPRYHPESDKRPLRLLTPEERRARREWKQEEAERRYIRRVLETRRWPKDPTQAAQLKRYYKERVEHLEKKHAEAALRREAEWGARENLDAIAAVRFLMDRIEALEVRVAMLEQSRVAGGEDVGRIDSEDFTPTR